jgi:hypothetical protein
MRKPLNSPALRVPTVSCGCSPVNYRSRRHLRRGSMLNSRTHAGNEPSTLRNVDDLALPKASSAPEDANRSRKKLWHGETLCLCLLLLFCIAAAVSCGWMLMRVTVQFINLVGESMSHMVRERCHP